jgi:pimeloyl-ACP methyl ester carboxylesterase
VSEGAAVALHFHERVPSHIAELPALVFLHHFGGSGRTWEPVMGLMAHAGFRCIAPDLRGFGDSASAGDDPGQFTVAEMANDVAALIERLRLGPHLLIGHSMGGKVALALVGRQPRDLQAVVLLAPSPPTPEPMSDTERVRLLGSYGERVAAEETVHKITARPLPDPLYAIAIADILRTSEGAWPAWLEHGSREDIAATLASVRSPVFIAVGGTDETITAPLVRREIAARLQQSALVRVIGGASHLLPLEAPSSVSNFVFECAAHVKATAVDASRLRGAMRTE